MRQTYPALSDDARAALEAFAEKYAKVEGGWKEHLTILWATGGDTQEPQGGLLRAIRNTYGPTWLMDVYAPLWRPDLPKWEGARWTAGRLEPARDPKAYLWSGDLFPPSVGETIFLAVNKLGEGVVTGYFTEDKWLGVIVRLTDGRLVHGVGVDVCLTGETAEARTALAKWGLLLLPRAEIMDTAFPVYAYAGAAHLSAEEIEAKHETVRTEWRERVSQYPGAWVVYDPSGDAEDWMLVGDDFAALAKESVEHHEEIADI